MDTVLTAVDGRFGCRDGIVLAQAWPPRRSASQSLPSLTGHLEILARSQHQRSDRRPVGGDLGVNGPPTASTAPPRLPTGGGVVELLRPLLGYSRGGGVDARWVVISGDSDFFVITKRLHNHRHGIDGDGGPLSVDEHTSYERTLGANAVELARLVRPSDVVILHDPQTAGLVGAVHATGATVIWRCHVGLDHGNARAREAWEFLAPYLREVDAYVFSRSAYMWEGVPPEKVVVIRPSIDVFSPKNADQSREQSLAILARAGLTSTPAAGDPTFTRSDGTPGRVDRRAEVLEEAPLSPERALVAQVSRWDRLKDPLGVLSGFAEHVADRVPVDLLLAGPTTASVADDPEGAEVFASVREAWHRLPAPIRSRVHLAALPMDDIEENAAIVNALQHHADVVVQKSLAEGFGLTVAEAMWKRRPVVGTRIGGIQDQIVDGESGVLISDPHDLAAFGAAVTGLLTEPERARRIGLAARERCSGSRRHDFSCLTSTAVAVDALAPGPMVPDPFVVISRRRDTADTWTLELEPCSTDSLCFAPGQFTMLSAGGAGEVPISISGDPDDPVRLVHTVRSVGLATQAICAATPGRKLRPVADVARHRR